MTGTADRPDASPRRPQTRREELANALTHGSGLAASLVGLPALVWAASRRGGPRELVACAVFAATLVLLYAASTLYHALPSSRAKRILRVVDHTAIYLLIAGSYTPFLLVSLRGTWGWSLFGVVWALAIVGIAQEIWLARGARIASLVIYLLMGWLALLAVSPLWHALGPAGFFGLVAGGLCYTGGVVFYVNDEKWRHGHGIWHLFVLAGSLCHFMTVWLFVA